MNLKIIVVLIMMQLPSYTIAQKLIKEPILTTLISKQKAGQDQLEYVDTTRGYRLVIPKWWTIKETPDPDFFGGTLPEIAHSKSAVLIKSFQKEKFKNLDNFKKWVISGYKSGDIPKWSGQHKLLFKKDIEEFADLGNAFKVQLKAEDTFYNCCYIIAETSRAFLWIDLTASRETYDANFKKLQQLMSHFEVL